MRLSESDLITICEKEAKTELTAAKYLLRIDKIVTGLKKENILLTSSAGELDWFVKIFDRWQLEVFKDSAKKGMESFKAYLIPIR